MSAIYFGKPPACPTCKETPGIEYMMRSRLTGRVKCDLCVDYAESAHFDYYAEGISE